MIEEKSMVTKIKGKTTAAIVVTDKARVSVIKGTSIATVVKEKSEVSMMEGK